MSFKNVTESMIADFIHGALNEKKVSIDIDWASEDGSLHKPLSKEYGIQIKPGRRMDAIVTGEQKKIVKFLLGPDYDMDLEDVQDLFPELFESKNAKVTDKTDDGDGMDPVGSADADIDNDGDTDASDEYLAKRRKTIGKAISKDKKESAGSFITKASAAKAKDKKKFEIGGEEYPVTVKKDIRKESFDLNEETFSNLSEWMKAVLKAGGGSTLSQAGEKFSARLGRNKSATFDLKKNKGSISESVELEEGFAKGDSVKVKNAKSYNALGKDEVAGTVTGMDGDKVKVKVGTGSMTVDAKDVISENTLLKTNKLSSAEYQKAKKLKGFSADDYTWDGDDQLYVKKSMKEDTDLIEGAIGDYKELIKFATSDGGADKGDMLKAAALMAKGDKAALKKHLDGMDSYPVDIVKEYM